MTVTMGEVKASILGIACSVFLSGCASVVPNFDIPVNESGPTIQSITRRVTCELADLIERDELKSALLIADMDVSLQLDLTVNDTGQLMPSVSYISGPLAVGVGGTLSQSREQNFTADLHYSLRALQKEAKLARKLGTDLADCWPIDTNLAGELGLKKAVALAFTGDHLDWKTQLAGAGQAGAIGGYVTFTVTKSLNAGPTWTLTNFTGPGSNLGTISEVNTDKIVFAFARGDKAGTPYGLSGKQKAEQLIQQMSINQISTQLSVRPLR